MLVSGILRGSKQKKRMCCCYEQTTHPPVCHELACRAISLIVPQYRLNFILLSNSRHSKESELALCLLPRMYPTRLLCCNQAALPHHLVFLLVLSHFPCRVSPVAKGGSNDR